MANKGEQLEKIYDNLKNVNEGLKDQISYEKELDKLYADRAKFSDRQFKSVTDVLDKTKDIFTNRKNLTEEQLTQVDLHKLERKLIAEGLQDHIQIVQKLKEEDKIQRRINNTINQSAKSYQNIGDSVDNLIKKIPVNSPRKLALRISALFETVPLCSNDTPSPPANSPPAFLPNSKNPP